MPKGRAEPEGGWVLASARARVREGRGDGGGQDEDVGSPMMVFGEGVRGEDGSQQQVSRTPFAVAGRCSG